MTFDPLLFSNDPNPKTLAKRDDPFTSRLGANEVSTKVGRMEQRAAEIVRLHPNKTGSELDRICGYTRRELSKRLRGAQRKGLVLADGHRKCRVTGRKAITWSVP